MQEKLLRARGLFLAAVMVTFSLAGCLEALDTTTKPRATLEVYPLLIQKVKWSRLMHVNPMLLKE